MSGNQKQAPSGAPQQQRYAQGPYAPRAATPQRADGYHVASTPTGFVPQQTTNQPSNQGPTIRGMAQSGPPNQSSTPPQNDIKQMQQSQSGPIPMYMQQVRGPTQPFYRTPPPPNQGGPRMPNHHRQTMASTVATNPQPLYSQMTIYPPLGSHTIPYQMQTIAYNPTRPPPSFYTAQATYAPIIPGQHMYSSFQTQPQQSQQFFYQNTTPIMAGRQAGPPPPVASAQQTGVQPTPQTIPISQPVPQQNKKKPRSNAIPIINPHSGKEIFEEDEQLPSGDSSARETPQPSTASNMQISADFAARVAIRASEDKETAETEPVHIISVQSHTFGSSVTASQHHNANTHIHGSHNAPAKENDLHLKIVDSNLVQNSKLQASTKEFIPDTTKHSPKENATPVVSANIEGAEIMLPSKSRERESPSKTRRQHQHQHHQHQQHQHQHQHHQQHHQHQHQHQHRESVPKEVPVLEAPVPQPNKEPVVPASPAVVVVQETIEPKIIKASAPAIQKVRSPNDNKGAPTVEHRPPIVPQTNSTAPVEDTSVSHNIGKNKSGSQKSKENTTSNQQIQQTSKPNMPVPGSQPPKPSSKSNKLRELNIKGASKEGTDMDAFSTSEVPNVENCNNNEPTVKEEITETPQVQVPPQKQPQQQIVQQQLPQQIISQQQAAQPPTQPPQPQQQQQPQPPQPQQSQQQPQQPQKLADVKTIPKPKVDVTSIVKEVSRPLKPQVQQQPQQQQQQQPTTDSQDETDRAACEKLVQVKNETNINKTNASENNDTQVIDKTVIRYKKDQWSPLNVTGKKCYDREFLIGLQNNPKCKKKPENLPDLDIVLKDNNRGRMDPRSFSHRQSEVLMPSFHKSSSQRGPLPKRNSQQGKASMKGGKPNTIHVTLSLREDVKLRETENAWRPARLSATVNMSEDELKTAELYKKVRGVLNKLTPEKFHKLLNQVRALSIDNAERLQGVIDLVFEKAVDEPNFSVAYALMCKELAMMQVPANHKSKEEPEFVNFRKLLITRCQIEFEKNSVDENARKIKVKEIEECTDPEKKKELQLILEEDDRRIRFKSVGNIRFIGELFKQQMLTVKIMIRCINILLDNKDEDSLECLCKLLTTIGKDLESDKKQDLSDFFNTMQEIIDKKHGKISSRVRFMLQDVIDLRNSKWVPRRQDLNPKTMEQIQKEADTEQLNIQVMNSGPINTPRKDDRMGSGGPNAGSDRKRRNNQTDDGWSMATSRSRTQYTVESSKLMNKPPPMEEMTLGSKNLFGQWGRGSNIKTQVPVTNTANMYAALENINVEQEKSRSSYDARMKKDPYSSKGHSLERSGYKQNYEDGRGSRSGSQQRTPSANQPQKSMPPTTPAPATPAPKQLDPEKLKLRMHNIMEEYLNDCCSLKECEADIKASIDPSKMEDFVFEGYNDVLERSKSTRRKTGALFAHLVKSQTLSTDVLCKALVEVLSQADDLVIDIPMLWDYLAEMILPLVTENVIPLDRLRDCMECLKEKNNGPNLLASLLTQLVEDNGPNYVVDLWQVSGVKFSDFFKAGSNVDSYVKDHKLDFLMGGAGTPVGQVSLSWEQVHTRLLQFFQSNTSFDTITDWISANVSERISENQFIRTLVTAVVENDITTVNNTKKIRIDMLKSHYTLLQRYVDNKEGNELQCLFALQALVHKWEHPPGLLLSILERLWEDSILSNDSFLAWEKDNDPAEQEGKAIALISLQRLFTALKEAEDESASSTSDEA